MHAGIEKSRMDEVKRLGESPVIVCICNLILAVGRYRGLGLNSRQIDAIDLGYALACAISMVQMPVPVPTSRIRHPGAGVIGEIQSLPCILIRQTSCCKPDTSSQYNVICGMYVIYPLLLHRWDDHKRLPREHDIFDHPCSARLDLGPTLQHSVRGITAYVEGDSTMVKRKDCIADLIVVHT